MKRGKTRNAARVGVMLIALLLLSGLMASTPQAGQPWKVASVEMVGVDSAYNNVIVLDDRTFLVAPYAPSKQPGHDADLEALDNHFINFVDLKRPSAEPLKKSIETPSGDKKVYYPTKVIFDDNGQTIYVRGTRFEVTDGVVNAIAVIAYAQLNRDAIGKPVFSEWVVIDIAGVGGKPRTAGDAPDDMVLGFGGKLLYFTNGASIFSFNIPQGYLYEVKLVTEEAFNAGGLISYLGIDNVTETLSVYWNRQGGEGDNVKTLSELSFYSLSDDGTMQLDKRLYAGEEIPKGVFIPAGSNIKVLGALDASGKFLPSSSAFVATSDGSICQIDLAGEGVSSPLKSLYKFDSLATQGSVDGNSPLVLKFDAANRLIGVVKQGYTAQIRKPTNNRRGSVIRTLSAPAWTEPPTLVVARLGKNLSRVVSGKDFSEAFGGEIGLTSPIDGHDGQWLMATHSGKLLAMNLAGGFDALQLEQLTEVGDRTGGLAYFDSRNSIVAVNSFGLDAAQQQISIPGRVVVARQTGTNTQSYSISSASTVTTNRASGGQNPTLSIRRPCNISKK